MDIDFHIALEVAVSPTKTGRSQLLLQIEKMIGFAIESIFNALDRVVGEDFLKMKELNPLKMEFYSEVTKLSFLFQKQSFSSDVYKTYHPLHNDHPICHALQTGLEDWVTVHFEGNC